MDSFEFTKIAGAVLSALLLIFGTKVLIDSTTGHRAEKPGYTLAAAEPAKPTATAEGGATAANDAAAKDAPAGETDIVALLGKANADNGKTVFGKCKTCHSSEKGKPNAVGPNLWGVINRPKGSVEGFKYSDAMKSKGGEWTFESLSQFLRNPKTYIPGTKMVFSGIPNPQDEADLISYLATLADTPVPLPK